MSERNKAIAHRLYEEVINQGKLDIADELLAPDSHSHAGAPSGPEGLERHVSMLRAAFPDLHHSIEDVIAEGNKVVVRTTLSGTHVGDFMGIPATGRQFTQEHIHILRLEQGKVAEHWAQMDNVGMMRQLGVMPAPEPARI